MANELLNLTELERVEFNRRVDCALAIVPVASAAMEKRKELTEAIQVSAKKSKSYWYWALGGAGFAIHYFVSGDEYKFDAGGWLMVVTFAHWWLLRFDIYTNQRTLSGISEKTTSLQMMWESVIGNKNDFFRIADLDIGWVMNWEDDAFSDWWAAQTNHILMRVCDVEKALDLCRKRDSERAAMKSMEMKSQREDDFPD